MKRSLWSANEGTVRRYSRLAESSNSASLKMSLSVEWAKKTAHMKEMRKAREERVLARAKKGKKGEKGDE